MKINFAAMICLFLYVGGVMAETITTPSAVIDEITIDDAGGFSVHSDRNGWNVISRNCTYDFFYYARVKKNSDGYNVMTATLLMAKATGISVHFLGDCDASDPTFFDITYVVTDE